MLWLLASLSGAPLLTGRHHGDASLSSIRVGPLAQLLACVQNVNSCTSPAALTLNGHVVTFLAAHAFLFAVVVPVASTASAHPSSLALAEVWCVQWALLPAVFCVSETAAAAVPGST